MENKILPSSSGGYSDSRGTHLGQRISTPVDLPEFSWPLESTLKENGLLIGTATEGSKLTSIRKSQANEFEKVNHHHPLLMQQFQSTHQPHAHSNSDIPTGEIPEMLNWISKTNNLFVQSDTGKSGDSYTEKSHYHTYQKDLVSENPVVASMMPLKMHNLSSEFVREAGAVGNNSCVLEQNHQWSNSFGSNNPSSRDFLSSGVSTSTEQKVGGRSLHDLLKASGRSHVEGDMKMKDQEAIDTQNMKSSLTDDLSSKDGQCPSNGIESNSNHSSHGLDEKSRLPSNKMPLAAEKLWGGSLQLNSSVTVSVVAFFKSGEKLLDIKWSEFVEVKGKVRLDAFEKYIKDLPRSRNRGLMVISLCFKEGSSEKGLKGMKEVAKGYTKGERVGFAQLSPNVDLYLCPRSDAIITILAKYGFFKGMAAVEGNSELMIGCVVWKKQPASTSSVAKISEGKANSLPEPSDSSSLQVGGQSSVENSNPSTPLNSVSTLEQADVTDDKNVVSGSSSRITSATASIRSPPFQQKESRLPSSHFWGSSSSIATPSKGSADLPNPVTSLLSNASKAKMVFSDDDDLPEFDFAAAATGISSGSHCSDKRLQLSGSNMSKQPTVLAPMSIPRSISSASQGMPNVNDHGQPKSTTVPMAITVSASGSPMVPLDNLGRKNIFCDDDMPEWLPPANEKTNEPPGTFPPESSNSISRKLPPFPTGSVFPYPSSTTTHDRFSAQQSPRLYHPPANSKVPPPIPSKDGPSYLTGFTFNPVPRPQSGTLAPETSLQHADKRVRRS